MMLTYYAQAQGLTISYVAVTKRQRLFYDAQSSTAIPSQTERSTHCYIDSLFTNVGSTSSKLKFSQKIGEYINLRMNK